MHSFDGKVIMYGERRQWDCGTFLEKRQRSLLG